MLLRNGKRKRKRAAKPPEAQSLKGRTLESVFESKYVREYCSPWQEECFQDMIGNETTHANDFYAFYHSFRRAYLLYEIHGVIARMWYGYDNSESCFPRIDPSPFVEIPDARTLTDLVWPRGTLDDGDRQFQEVGICAVTNLFGGSPDMMSCFAYGYESSPLNFNNMLYALLAKVAVRGIDEAELESICGQISKAAKDVDIEPRGHLLQIFVRKDVVDEFCYASRPGGELDRARHPLSKSMKEGVVQGQARICCPPHVFSDPGKVRGFLYSACKRYHTQGRKTLIDKLTRILERVVRRHPVPKHAYWTRSSASALSS